MTSFILAFLGSLCFNVYFIHFFISDDRSLVWYLLPGVRELMADLIDSQCFAIISRMPNSRPLMPTIVD